MAISDNHVFNRTTTKCHKSDGGHGVGDSHGCNSTATLKSVIAYGDYSIWNGYTLQTFTITVFASLFLSAIYILNGRKVVTWIL